MCVCVCVCVCVRVRVCVCVCLVLLDGLVCVWRGQVESFKYTIHKHTCVVQESHQDGPEIVVQYKVVKFSSDT